MPEEMWRPSPEKIRNSKITDFLRFYNQEHGLQLHDYWGLYDESVQHTDRFWNTLLGYSPVMLRKSPLIIRESTEMFGTRFFPDAEVNYAENILRHQSDDTAIISYREHYDKITLTFNKLKAEVIKVATYLRKIGIQKGDRIAGFVGNTPEAVIAMLATSAIGAIWSSTSLDFGVKGVTDRFLQIAPTVLFAQESYYYNGKHIDCTQKILEIAAHLPCLKQTIIIPEYNDFKGTIFRYHESDSVPQAVRYDQIAPVTPNTFLEFTPLPFHHPLYILYSSGTTGKPKCIVHGAGGTLLQHYKEHALHTDIGTGDTVFYYTTTGWMMWNWLVGTLFTGASIVLYDGNPVYPTIDVLWKLAEEEKVSVFGTSPKYLQLLEAGNYRPIERYKLASLKALLSTGSPLAEESFRFVYNHVKKDIQLSSISGGTDIVSCFMLGSPILPVHSGEIQCPGLGMSVKVFDEDGQAITSGKGELVCDVPFPSMPVFFWNDPENVVYKRSYFEHFPGVWRHGDYISFTENRGVIVYGRSDATLNPGGVRIGTAEIYSVVEAIPEVEDAIAAGRTYNNDVQIVLFIKLHEGFLLSLELESRIKASLRNAAGPRFVPSFVIQVSEIPRTISGKKVEIAVSKILDVQHVDNGEALINPHCLTEYYAIAKRLSSAG